MKKLFLFFVGVLCATAVWAAPSKAKNTMKMVAYFPVPYVAYDTVSATQTLDVGVLNTCALSLGENTSNLGGSNCSLYLHGAANGSDDRKRGLLNVSSGKLNLNASGFGDPLIKSATVLVGSGGQPDYGWLDIGMPSGKADTFDALYISSIAKDGNSLRAKKEAKVNEFKMFDEINGNFPACDKGSGTVTWQELELGANKANKQTYKDIYLMCGDVKLGEPEPYTGCATCSAYDVGTADYERCVLKNVTSCCSYAESIYTKLGKNSYEEMKKTSCYDCSHRVSSGTDVINENISLSVSDLQYITGDTFPSSYANTEIDCMDKGFPLGNGKGWQSFTKCSADGTCAGSDSCVKRCKITACRPQYIGGKINEYWCHVNSVNLACLCSRNGW